METPRLDAPRPQRAIAIFLIALFIGSAAFATVGTIEALEEREAAVAVTDLRLAVITALDIEAGREPTPAEQERLQASIEVLSGNRENALHAVPEDRRTFTTTELDKMLQHARSISAGMMMESGVHSVAAHEELEAELRSASLAASTDAAVSERRAGATGIASIGLLALLGFMWLRTRSQVDRTRAYDEANHAAALQLGALLDESADAICIRDVQGDLSYRSAQFDRLFDPNHVKNFSDLEQMLCNDRTQDVITELSDSVLADLSFDVRLAEDSEQHRREFRMRVSDLSADPVVAGHLVSLREMTEDNQTRRELEALVVTDSLTGLPNRRALMQRLGESTDAHCSLLMIDLDEFKRTNDTHGHDAGDELLRAVASRFRNVLSDDERLFRLGGDEFAVLTQREGQPELSTLADRLLSVFEEPVALSSGPEEVRGSIGIATGDGQSSRLSLLRRADIALYAAKSEGGHRYQMLRPDLEQRSTRQREISVRLHSVNLDNEFQLVFQPIVDSTTGSVVFVEALVRWSNPELGMIFPDEFIPMSESSGRIVDIGLWVLEEALRHFSQWRSGGLAPNLALTVNVSPRQLEEDSFVDQTLDLLDKYNVRPGALVLEVTESALVEPGKGMVERLERLRAAGCLVACDDFGSGYSNLGQLMTLPLDLIKVDRQLLLQLTAMRDMAEDSSQACQVMGAIATIGMAMNAPIVAEGVETEVQRRSLQASGVHYLQGYYFSRPVGPKDIPALLENPLRVINPTALV